MESMCSVNDGRKTRRTGTQSDILRDNQGVHSVTTRTPAHSYLARARPTMVYIAFLVHAEILLVSAKFEVCLHSPAVSLSCCFNFQWFSVAARLSIVLSL